MGFINNVNVDVRGASHIAPCTYKTVILKKNITKENLNVLTQAMLDEYNINTKFVIKWDYVLKTDIIIPNNCILKFDGGSILGEHTITGQNTGIEAGLVKIFGTDVTFSGSWTNDEVFIDWFGDINKIKECVLLGTKVTLQRNTTYYLDTYVELKSGTIIDGNGSTVILRVDKSAAKLAYNNTYVFYLSDINNAKITNIKLIRNSNVLTIIGLFNTTHIELSNIDMDIPEEYSDFCVTFDLFYGNKFINISNCYINHVNDTAQGGAWIRNFFEINSTENIVIQNCTFVNKKADEVIAIWANAGYVKNVLVDNCQFISKQGNNNTPHLVSIGRVHPDETKIDNTVIIQNSTFELETSETSVVASSSFVKNCSINNCLIIAKEDQTNIAKHVIFNNCEFQSNGKNIKSGNENTFNNCTFKNMNLTIRYSFLYSCKFDVTSLLFDYAPIVKNCYIESQETVTFNHCENVWNNIFDIINSESYIVINTNIRFENNICNGIIKFGSGVYTEQYIRNNICTDLLLYGYTASILENNIIKNKPHKGTTENRPTFGGFLGTNSPWIGFEYFDTDLGKPIYVKNTGNHTVTWVDATGATV